MKANTQNTENTERSLFEPEYYRKSKTFDLLAAIVEWANERNSQAERGHKLAIQSLQMVRESGETALRYPQAMIDSLKTSPLARDSFIKWVMGNTPLTVNKDNGKLQFLTSISKKERASRWDSEGLHSINPFDATFKKAKKEKTTAAKSAIDKLVSYLDKFDDGGEAKAAQAVQFAKLIVSGEFDPTAYDVKGQLAKIDELRGIVRSNGEINAKQKDRIRELETSVKSQLEMVRKLQAELIEAQKALKLAKPAKTTKTAKTQAALQAAM
jgi:hypothetical protein